MKKFMALVLLSVIIFSGRAQAQESNWDFGGGVRYNRFSLEDSNTHIKWRNSYLNDVKFDGWEDTIHTFDDLNSSFGFFGEGRYWFTDSIGVGMEVQYNSLGTDYRVINWSGYNLYKETYKLDLLGTLGQLTYRLGQEEENIVWDISLGLGRYKSTFDWQKEMDFQYEGGDKVIDRDSNSYEGSTFGFKGELEARVFEDEDIRINLNASYRRIIFDRLTDRDGEGFRSLYTGYILEEEEFDFSGFGFGASVDIKF